MERNEHPKFTKRCYESFESQAKRDIFFYSDAQKLQFDCFVMVRILLNHAVNFPLNKRAATNILAQEIYFTRIKLSLL